MAACVAVISAISTSAAAGCKVRVIDIDPGTVALPRTWKKERGTLALVLARDDALVFGDMEGHYLHPSGSPGPSVSTWSGAARHWAMPGRR